MTFIPRLFVIFDVISAVGKDNLLCNSSNTFFILVLKKKNGYYNEVKGESGWSVVIKFKL